MVLLGSTGWPKLLSSVNGQGEMCTKPLNLLCLCCDSSQTIHDYSIVNVTVRGRSNENQKPCSQTHPESDKWNSWCTRWTRDNEEDFYSQQKQKKSPFIPMICEKSNIFQQKNEMYGFLFEEENMFFTSKTLRKMANPTLLKHYKNPEMSRCVRCRRCWGNACLGAAGAAAGIGAMIAASTRRPPGFPRRLETNKNDVEGPQNKKHFKGTIAKTGDFFLFSNRFGFAIHKKFVSFWMKLVRETLWNACLMRPLQNSLKGFGSRDWDWWRFVGEEVKQIFDGMDAGLKYWIKLNQVERIKQNQTPSIILDPIISYALSHFAPGEVDSWREWQRILPLRLHEMPGVFPNPFETLKTSKKWRDHIKQMIFDKTASILHCFINSSIASMTPCGSSAPLAGYF